MNILISSKHGIKVESGKMYNTDGNHYSACDSDLPDGFYRKQGSGFVKDIYFSGKIEFDRVIEPVADKIELPAEYKANILNVSKFVSDDETRYFMNGIHFESESLTATDGRHLLHVKQRTGIHENFILPIIPAIQNMLKDKEKIPVFFQDCKGYAIFEKGSYIVKVKKIDGQFPHYVKVIDMAREEKTLGNFTITSDNIKFIKNEIRLSGTNPKKCGITDISKLPEFKADLSIFEFDVSRLAVALSAGISDVSVKDMKIWKEDASCTYVCMGCIR